MIPDYEGMSIEELEAEAKRKELILKNMRLDRQLGNSKPEAELIDDIYLAKIYKLLQRKGTITTADVNRYIRPRSTFHCIQNAMMELVESGKARVVPSHKGLKITAV